jgi:hypothetical protein
MLNVIGKKESLFSLVLGKRFDFCTPLSYALKTKLLWAFFVEFEGTNKMEIFFRTSIE